MKNTVNILINSMYFNIKSSHTNISTTYLTKNSFNQKGIDSKNTKTKRNHHQKRKYNAIGNCHNTYFIVHLKQNNLQNK